MIVGRFSKAVDGIYRAVNAIHGLVDAIYKPFTSGVMRLHFMGAA